MKTNGQQTNSELKALTDQNEAQKRQIKAQAAEIAKLRDEITALQVGRGMLVNVIKRYCDPEIARAFIEETGRITQANGEARKCQIFSINAKG